MTKVDRQQTMEEVLSEFSEETVIMQFDGSCTNTRIDGYMGAGVHAYKKQDEKKDAIFKLSEYTGVGTHNESEYIAVTLGLKELIKQSLTDQPVVVLGDSNLIIKQLTGEYKTSEFRMFKMRNSVLSLTKQFKNITFKHIPRELNSYADNLAKKATKGKRMTDYYKYRF